MEKPKKVTYARSVFLNCPFDEHYQPIFRALIFAIEFCGFFARCALEGNDSSETRIEKIQRLIRDSKYGIHDLSRIESNDMGLPRFNMPFEFGVFLGFKWAGAGKQKQKRSLVLAHEPYLYQQYLSDIAGQDIQHHGNQPESAIRCIRSWLRAVSGEKMAFGGDFIVEQFKTFSQELPLLLADIRKTRGDLSDYHEYHGLVCEWIENNTKPKE